jgi:hypothetical protein
MPTPSATPETTSPTAQSNPNGGILDVYPGLQKFVAKEHASSLYFGFGVSPFTLVNSKIGFGLSLFQLHWMKGAIDWEVFNASFSNVFGQTYGNEQIFLLRTVPKFQVFKNVSIGPMLGVEFVHFPDVTDKLTKNNLYSQQFEFSTLGIAYGGVVSENFPLANNNYVKVNEIVYREGYSANGTNNGWTYYYLQNPLNFDKGPIAASTVFLLEISFLY